MSASFPEALTQMLETSAVEMARRPRYRRPANSERNRRRAKIEQRQNDLQHGLEAGAVVRELQTRARLRSHRASSARRRWPASRDHPKIRRPKARARRLK